jgi:2-aminobenzoate-CoA ligase
MVDKKIISYGSPSLIYALPELHVAESFNFVSDSLQRNCRECGDMVAYYFVTSRGVIETTTWKELARLVDRFAAGLERLGVEPGDRVLIGFRERPELMAVMLSAMRIGAIAVPFSPMARCREIADLVSRLAARVVIGDHAAEAELMRLDMPKQVIVWSDDGSSSFRTLDDMGDHSDPAPASTSRDDPAIIFHTSGTTDKPKACLHSHRAIAAQSKLVGRFNFKAVRGDIAMNVGPAVHAFGFVTKIGIPLTTGCSAVLYEQFTKSAFNVAVNNLNMTHLVGPTTLWRGYLLETDRIDLSSVRYIESIGYDQAVYEGLHGLGLHPVNPFGMAPMAGYITMVTGEEPDGSLGSVLPGYEAYVVEADPAEAFGKDGSPIEVPAGQFGKLAVRGPTGIAYVGSQDYAERDSINGWSVLDDAFERDTRGFLWARGRYGNVIKTNGYSVAPAEVEAVLNLHPKVSRSAVFGVSDGERGEIVTAVVELTPEIGTVFGEALASELQQYVKARIAPYKYPRHLEFTDVLPVDHLGKINYAKLKAAYEVLK